jgi:hypothetical protein
LFLLTFTDEEIDLKAPLDIQAEFSAMGFVGLFATFYQFQQMFWNVDFKLN